MLTWQDWRVIIPKGWGQQGRWLLRFATAGKYNVRVLTKSDSVGGQAQLHIGTVTRTLDVTGPLEEFVFQNVPVPEGEADLLVDITGRDGKQVPPVPGVPG